MRLHSPEYWRSRAEEARTIAECASSIENRHTMLDIVDKLEELANRAERLAAKFDDVEWTDDAPKIARH